MKIEPLRLKWIWFCWREAKWNAREEGQSLPILLLFAPITLFLQFHSFTLYRCDQFYMDRNAPSILLELSRWHYVKITVLFNRILMGEMKWPKLVEYSMNLLSEGVTSYSKFQFFITHSSNDEWFDRIQIW